MDYFYEKIDFLENVKFYKKTFTFGPLEIYLNPIKIKKTEKGISLKFIKTFTRYSPLNTDNDFYQPAELIDLPFTIVLATETLQERNINRFIVKNLTLMLILGYLIDFDILKIITKGYENYIFGIYNAGESSELCLFTENQLKMLNSRIIDLPFSHITKIQIANRILKLNDEF